MKKTALFIAFVLSLNFVIAQSIEITGNGIGIPIDGSNVPKTEDNTYFGTVTTGGSVVHDFIITNITNTRFKISSVVSSNPDFIVKPPKGTIQPGASKTLTITFEPTSADINNAVITIYITDGTSYTFNVAGKSNLAFGDIMISQYYHNGIDEIIEIKNLTDSDFQSGVISYTIDGGSQILLGIIPVGVPITVNISGGNNKTIELVNTNNGEILDIIGDNSDWGSNKSFTKGACATEEPHTIFNINDWIELDLSEVVISSISDINIDVGVYNKGITKWNGLWDNGNPDRTRDVEINALYDTNSESGDLEACNLTVTDEINYDGSTTKSIIVYSDLTINSSLIIGDTESLVMYDGIVNYDGIFTKIENSEEKNISNDVTYWSSPVEGVMLTEKFPNVDTNRMFMLNPISINPIYSTIYPKYEHWFNYTGAMELGKGYSIEGDLGAVYPALQIVEFTGKPHNGTYNVIINTGISSTEPVQDNMNYNLIGNPYPSAIDPDIFINTNEGKFTGTIYVWSQRIDNIVGGEYQDPGYYHYNLTGGVGGSTEIPDGTNYKIASGQAFMIEALNTSAIVFNNNMRVVGNNDMFYKSVNSKRSSSLKNERNRMWLRITNTDNIVREQLIGFFDVATDGVDYGYDGQTVNGKDYNFYSLLENNKYTIQSFGTYASNKIVALGFDTEKIGEFTIGISKMEGILNDQEIYLVDNFLNITHDLKKGDYEFTQNKTGEIKDRFKLKFTATTSGIDNIIKTNDFIISTKGDTFIINSSQTVKSIRVFDMFARKLIDEKPNKSNFHLPTHNINKGSVLILRVQLENGFEISKKVIKH
ncbi:MAG: DUF1573 domain-containing protein [Bacteroidota bacterium]